MASVGVCQTYSQPGSQLINESTAELALTTYPCKLRPQISFSLPWGGVHVHPVHPLATPVDWLQQYLHEYNLTVSNMLQSPARLVQLFHFSFIADVQTA